MSTSIATIDVRTGRALAEPSVAIVPISVEGRSMGGRLVVHLDTAGAGTGGNDEARRAARLVIARVNAWAARLTRHSNDSDLAYLNADPADHVRVRPTLAAALRAGRLAGQYGEGLVDVTMLDARLAAESGDDPVGAARSSEWQIDSDRHGSAMVSRPAGLHFDLGGVGKGWIADRALSLLHGWPGAVVDADGDLAVSCAPGRHWEVAVGDPRSDDVNLAVLHLGAQAGGPPVRWGVATSGVSIHRWASDGRVRHHLIDPRTGRPAETDVVQATVIAGSALRAEALAKAALIAGTAGGFALLDRARVPGALILNDRGEALALPSTLRLLAG